MTGHTVSVCPALFAPIVYGFLSRSLAAPVNFVSCSFAACSPYSSVSAFFNERSFFLAICEYSSLYIINYRSSSFSSSSADMVPSSITEVLESLSLVISWSKDFCLSSSSNSLISIKAHCPCPFLVKYTLLP